jgi:hypothetical protein
MRRAVSVLAFCALLAGVAQAQAPSFTARVDRNQVAMGDVLVLEVTLSLQDGPVSDYRPPEIRGARIVSEQPSQSTQIHMGGGRTFSQVVYSWRYELAPAQKGTITIGAARVKVSGRELRSTPVTVAVGEGAPRSAASRRGVSPLSGIPFTSGPEPGDGQNFVRVIPSKTKAYVGEQVTVEWFLYLTARQDKYQTVTEPRADGFWSEDLPVPTNQHGLQLTRQLYEGQEYLVAPLLRRALFPLTPGRLSITPMESEISQVDFFGSTMRTQRLKTEPVVIEVQPLPTAGQPRGFDPAAVGRFSLAARVDREQVAVGEAVTLTLTINGQGNVRKLPPPSLPRLDGWKVYDPKIAVTIEPGDVVSGTKTVDYLLLPERAGITVIPSFMLPAFDPAARSYNTEKTSPLRIVVVGEKGAGMGSNRGKPVVSPPTGMENVLGIDIRPLRSRPTLRRDLGTTFYRSRLFLGALGAPPLAFGLTVLVGRIRERLNQETESARRRKLRRLVRRRLGAAERHLRDGQPGPFFVEIDRGLRDFLSGKLGRPVTGLSRDELRAHLAAGGLAPEMVGRTIDVLEECDRARFAQGSANQNEMRAALERAGEIILQIERARLKELPE